MTAATTRGLAVRTAGEIAWVVLDRPEKRNPISLEMWQALPELLAELEQDTAVKLVVLRGVDSTAFSAGADIGEFETLLAGSEGAVAYDRAAERAETVLAELAKPTIAMIQGPCIGAGCGLAIACDFRFSDASGRFAITAANLGVVYGFAATKRLVELVGHTSAKYLLFSGRLVDAARARELGLVDLVVGPDEIERATLDFAEAVAARAQFSVRATKRMVGLVLDGQTADSEETRRWRSTAFDTEDYREGVRAFLDKRPPAFTYS